jgi:hypothetical protein
LMSKDLDIAEKNSRCRTYTPRAGTDRSICSRTMMTTMAAGSKPLDLTMSTKQAAQHQLQTLAASAEMA